MASLNKAMIIGHLGKDPEVRYTASGNAIANITVATSESWKDKNTGEKKEVTEWHRCTAYHKLAEIMGQYLKKGSLVYIEGQLKTRKWKDKEGHDRYTTEIQVDEIKMLGGKQDGGSTNPPHRNSQGGKPSFDDLGDDIPFAPHAARGALSHVI